MFESTWGYKGTLNRVPFSFHLSHSENINVLVDRQLIDTLKEKLKDTNTSLKSYLENLIQSDLDK